MAAKRRTVRPRKTRRARSAAQRANDRRLGAMARARARGRAAPAKRRRRRSSPRTTVVVASGAPARRRRRSSVSRAAPVRRRRRSSGMRLGGSGGMVNSAVALLKDGAIMGAGALGVDIVMGQVNKVLPDGWDSPLETDGTPNYKNAAVKALVSVGIGYAGARYLPASMRNLAMKAAAGSLSIQAYNLIKESIPSDFLPLGGVSQDARLMGAPRNTLTLPGTRVPGNTGILAGLPRVTTSTYQRRG